ncbi:MAG: hypothetical protein KME08_03845 [Aphanothece sp. CMT-3BRIN-NPC111]|jgi:C4-type Zn-finger protein|nr:hypothetical protein [Aphanothece sp. CMT-3BRIN-NPC111]
MPNCPYCHQPIGAQAIACPYCRTILKAYGHPGITLHRANGETFLCDSCTYHEDDTCTFPQRPYARECTLYQNKFQQNLQLNQHYHASGWGQIVSFWCQRNQARLMLLGLAVVSFLLALIAMPK